MLAVLLAVGLGILVGCLVIIAQCRADLRNPALWDQEER